MRQKVVELARELAARGFLAGTGGNIALKVDADAFAVTPSAMDYYVLEASDVPVLRLHDMARLEGEHAPSVESALHACVFRKRPECLFSIHTHQPIASACALLGKPLAVEDPGQRTLLGARVAVVGYAPSGTAWLASKLDRALDPAINAYLMRNHGVLCCGVQIERAVPALIALESLCAAQLRTLILARMAREALGRERLRAVVNALGASVRPNAA